MNFLKWTCGILGVSCLLVCYRLSPFTNEFPFLLLPEKNTQFVSLRKEVSNIYIDYPSDSIQTKYNYSFYTEEFLPQSSIPLRYLENQIHKNLDRLLQRMHVNSNHITIQKDVCVPWPHKALKNFSKIKFTYQANSKELQNEYFLTCK